MGRVLPILFNTDMIRAILEGRKTVTRRVVRQDKVKQILSSPARKENPDIADENFIKCLLNMPHEPGDILYVRESGIIQSMKNFDKGVKIFFPADDSLIEFKVTPDEYERLSRFPKNKKISPYWLTKQESRIFLKVVDVWVERLQDITNEQILKEGASEKAIRSYIAQMPESTEEWIKAAHLMEWQHIWNSALRKSDPDIYGWDSNPWVWVTEFERYEISVLHAETGQIWLGNIVSEG